MYVIWSQCFKWKSWTDRWGVYRVLTECFLWSVQGNGGQQRVCNPQNDMNWNILFMMALVLYCIVLYLIACSAAGKWSWREWRSRMWWRCRTVMTSRPSAQGLMTTRTRNQLSVRWGGGSISVLQPPCCLSSSNGYIPKWGCRYVDILLKSIDFILLSFFLLIFTYYLLLRVQ